MRPRKGGEGLKCSIPMAVSAKLVELIKSPEILQRHTAVMQAEGMFEVEFVKVAAAFH